jgi:hypothetical protein
MDETTESPYSFYSGSTTEVRYYVKAHENTRISWQDFI